MLKYCCYQSAYRFVAVAIVVILLITTSCDPTSDTIVDETSSTSTSTISLQEQTPESTGITFNNTISDEGNLNVFVWNFLYSGGGVAAGDINNDGLPDVFFAGNQVPDRLYLNKGNFQFEDITASAGITDNQWSTGVTMADVNADGLLDIYVCKNSPITRAISNVNRLWINQGDGRFLEQAEEYGLADIGFSIQATFFDADADGDLDVYLVNQPIDQFAQYINRPDDVAVYPVTDRFFISENGSFHDVTSRQMTPNARFGLGVTLADVNEDGQPDIYVCNDYHHADHLWINRNGRFADELAGRVGHTSFYSMGSDEGDINNDGHQDLFVLDMAFESHYRSKTNMESMNPERFWGLVEDGQHFQYAQNTLQLNRGEGQFSEIAQLSGLSKTDWSWSPLFVDLDHDGHQDILVTNGIYRDMKNNDFNAFVKRKFQGQVGPSNYLEVLDSLPSSPVANKLFQNHGGLKFDDISDKSGFNLKGFSHGMAVADFNQDGLMDVVVNNMNAPASIYRNVSTTPRQHWLTVALTGPAGNANGLGASVTVFFDGQRQTRTMQTTRGYFSSSPPILHFGVGAATSVDSVRVHWFAREYSIVKSPEVDRQLNIAYSSAIQSPHLANETTTMDAEGEIGERHLEAQFDDYASQVLLPYKLSQNGPFVATGDVDHDGKEDMIIGGAAGQPTQLLLQQADGAFSISAQPAFLRNAAREDGQIALFDLENDGDLDIYVACGSNEHDEGSHLLRDVMYVNDGKGLYTDRSSNVLPDLRINGMAVESLDSDSDGDLDLFVGGRLIAGQYPLPAQSAFLINSNGRMVIAPDEYCDCLDKLGLVTDVTSADFDLDDDMDLLVVGEWMAPTLLTNEGGHFTCKELSDPGVGIWWSVASADFDGDGDQDIVLGNLGWNQKFGGRKAPNLKVYAGDVDRNGDHDVVLAKTSDGKTLPVRGRECSSQEMPFILGEFPTFDQFASADLNQILSEEQREESYFREIQTFSSVVLINDNGNFTAHELPVECQFGPVKAWWPVDYDEDGDLDLFFAGNHLPVEVETARYDALGSGTV